MARSGRVLLTRESPRVGILGMLQGDAREHDMSFLDYSFAADIAPDASVLLFDEEGEAGGANYTVFVRKSDHSPVVRLGEGNAMAISPDGKWALSMSPAPNSPFVLLPTGTGEPQDDLDDGAQPGAGGRVAAGQREPRLRGGRAGARTRLFVQPIDGGKPRPISPEGIVVALPGFAVSPDGKWVAAIQADRKGALFPIDGGAPRPFSGVEPGEFPLRFSSDGKALYLWKRGDVPAVVTRLDIESGRASPSRA